MAKILKKARNPNPKGNLCYVVMERGVGFGRDWDVCDDISQEFLTVEEAMTSLKFQISQDPKYFEDREFRVAAIGADVITVKLGTTWDLVIAKGE